VPVGGADEEDVTMAVNCTKSPALAGFTEEMRVVVVADERSSNTVPMLLAPPPPVVPYKLPAESMTRPACGPNPSLPPVKAYSTFSL
jgi:hypothetical protein